MRAEFAPFYQSGALEGELVEQGKYSPVDLEGVDRYEVELRNEDGELLVLDCHFVAAAGEYESVDGLVHGVYLGRESVGDLRGAVVLQGVPAAFVSRVVSVSVQSQGE